MSACIERHLHGCSEMEKAVVVTMKDKLMSQVNTTCPEVQCDICKAQRCLQRLDNVTDNVEYCR